MRNEKFSVGDLVEVNGEEAVVSMPNGPSGTIGVKINGSLVMADYKDIKRISKKRADEAVMGMSGMGSVGAGGMAQAAQMSGLARMRQLAGMPPVEASTVGAQDDDDDAMQVNSYRYATGDELSGDMDGDMDGDADYSDDERWSNDGANTSEVDIDDADDGDYPVPVSPMLATQPESCSDIVSMLDDMDGCLDTIPVSEFRAVIDRLKALTKRAEEMRLGLVMEAKKGKGNKGNLAKPFTKFTANKAPPFKKGKKVAEATSSKKTFADYLGEVADDEQTLGDNPQDSVKSINARMGGKPDTMAAAQQAFNKLTANGVIKRGPGGKSTMAAMGDDDFNNLLK